LILLPFTCLGVILFFGRGRKQEQQEVEGQNSLGEQTGEGKEERKKGKKILSFQVYIGEQKMAYFSSNIFLLLYVYRLRDWDAIEIITKDLKLK
jgi:hypothetical protein